YYDETKHEISAAFHDGSMRQHIDGVNSLQDVPFRINERVLNAVKRHADSVLLREIKRSGDRDRMRTLLKNDIDVAEAFTGKPFKIPINCDFRGRLNSLTHFKYQREDYVRALF